MLSRSSTHGPSVPTTTRSSASSRDLSHHGRKEYYSARGCGYSGLTFTANERSDDVELDYWRSHLIRYFPQAAILLLDNQKSLKLCQKGRKDLAPCFAVAPETTAFDISTDWTHRFYGQFAWVWVSQFVFGNWMCQPCRDLCEYFILFGVSIVLDELMHMALNSVLGDGSDITKGRSHGGRQHTDMLPLSILEVCSFDGWFLRASTYYTIIVHQVASVNLAFVYSMDFPLMQIGYCLSLFLICDGMSSDQSVKLPFTRILQLATMPICITDTEVTALCATKLNNLAHLPSHHH
ncbi:hypothetical protein NC652_004824 [Populus alba x Populus x berolinensis]|nr:hypothetical protein NC652_004824 [Populus alba x Populus x berolinensis]